METIRLAQLLAKSELSQYKSKIPEYARDFKNEYLFVRLINKESGRFEWKYLLDASKLFISSYSDRIKFLFRKFLKAQELDYLKDISSFTTKECDVDNINYLFERMKYDFEDDEFVDGHPHDFPGYREFYEFFSKFYNKLNIEFLETDSESDSELDEDDIEAILNGTYNK